MSCLLIIYLSFSNRSVHHGLYNRVVNLSYHFSTYSPQPYESSSFFLTPLRQKISEGVRGGRREEDDRKTVSSYERGSAIGNEVKRMMTRPMMSEG